MARTPRTRFAMLAALVAALAAALPTTASAATTGCDGQPLSQPFSRWLDPFSYMKVPGGSFETGAPAWTLLRGAKLVAGNEPWNVDGAGDSRSLELAAGSSATSPEFCAGLAYPTVRLFSRGSGLLNAMLVEVLYRDAKGILRSAPLPSPSLGRSWAPTLPLPTLAGLPILTGSRLALRITSLLGTNRIDDVYVDPWCRT